MTDSHPISDIPLVLGERSGFWCPTCALPSAVEAVGVLLDLRDRPDTVVVWHACRDCRHGWWPAAA